MQGPSAASSSQPPQHPTPASGPITPVPSADQDMAEADDPDEPAPPADIHIGPPSSTPAGDADTAMDEEPAAPIDVPMGSLDTAAAMDTEVGVGSGLGEQLVQAAQDAGIDLAFLEALPEELRAEVPFVPFAHPAGSLRHCVLCMSKPVLSTKRTQLAICCHRHRKPLQRHIDA